MRQQIFPARVRQLPYSLFLFLLLTSSISTATAQTRQPVVPLLDEVTVNPTTGLATAYFGYHNPNRPL
jgi:hypothetical protein